MWSRLRALTSRDHPLYGTGPDNYTAYNIKTLIVNSLDSQVQRHGSRLTYARENEDNLAFWQILSTIGLFLTYRTDSTDYLTISGFTSLNGLICLHSVLDKAGSQSVFKRT